MMIHLGMKVSLICVIYNAPVILSRSILIAHTTSYGIIHNLAVRKKPKKKKKKSKKEKRKSKNQSREESDDEEEDASGVRRSAVFNSFFPQSMLASGRGIKKPFTSTINEADLAAIGYADASPNENDFDPNDDLPTTSGRASMWSPASLVNAAQSKLSDAKTDRNGFYDNMKSKVQTMAKGKPDEMPNDFNLHNIAKSRKKKKYVPLQRHDSVVWGDESSVLSTSGADHEVGRGREEEADDDQGIEMVDDYSYSDSCLHEANTNYLINEKRVEKMMWRKDKRRLGFILVAAIIFFSVCLSLYISGKDDANKSSSPPPTSAVSNDDGIDRNEPPPRPLPTAPTTPIDGFDDSGFHTMTLADLDNIVNTITHDASILSNPHSPQSKALEWCKNDMKIYNVEVPSRVAQRYSLATLYYSTNGTGWNVNSNWGNGHECEWYGVGCETGESNAVHVTYLDLNSNHLDGVSICFWRNNG